MQNNFLKCFIYKIYANIIIYIFSKKKKIRSIFIGVTQYVIDRYEHWSYPDTILPCLIHLSHCTF